MKKIFLSVIMGATLFPQAWSAHAASYLCEVKEDYSLNDKTGALKLLRNNPNALIAKGKFILDTISGTIIPTDGFWGISIEIGGQKSLAFVNESGGNGNYFSSIYVHLYKSTSDKYPLTTIRQRPIEEVLSNAMLVEKLVVMNSEDGPAPFTYLTYLGNSVTGICNRI